MVGEGKLRLIAGLGNPGTQYDGTRHNCGFMLIDALLKDLSQSAAASAWREKNGAQLSDATIEGHKLVIIKPLKFMNLSGVPLNHYISFHKIVLDQVLVAHDDIDLPLGTVRIKLGGGDGGNNGVKSIMQLCGAEFVRVKLGVGRPPPDQQERDVADWVLSKFLPAEKTIVDQMIIRGIEAIKEICRNGLKAAQNKINVRLDNKEPA